MSFDALVTQMSRSSFGSFGLFDVVMALVCPALLCIGVVYTYRKIQMHNSYSPSFLLALYLLAALSGGVTLFIGDNIARAFGLLGAMSIIRFRNALKEPIDAVFVLWTLSLGMASGAGYYFAAVCFTAVTSLIALTVRYSGLADFGPSQSVIKITTQGSGDTLKSVEKILAYTTKQYRVLHELHAPTQSSRTQVYTLLPKKHVRLEDIEQRLGSLTGVEVGGALYRPAGKVAE